MRAIELELYTGSYTEQLNEMIYTPFTLLIRTANIRFRNPQYYPENIVGILASLLEWLHADHQGGPSPQTAPNHRQPHRTLVIDVCQRTTLLRRTTLENIKRQMHVQCKCMCMCSAGIRDIIKV